MHTREIQPSAHEQRFTFQVACTNGHPNGTINALGKDKQDAYQKVAQDAGIITRQCNRTYCRQPLRVTL